MRRPIDELELPDDPPGPRHRDIHDVRRPDGADGPLAAQGRAVDGKRVICGGGEEAAWSDANLVHADPLGTGVAELVDEIGESALVKGAVDPDRDPGTRHRALGTEDPEAHHLLLGLGERSPAARHGVLSALEIATQIEDLVAKLVVA